ncbi:MAG: OmpA family protein, partial [Kofleriaceae bacterium]
AGPAAAGAGPAAAGACGTPEEQAKMEAFRLRTDLHVDRNIPSSGFGMFDARYIPAASLMTVTVKVFFKFEDSTSAPGFLDRVRRTLGGEDLSRFYWSDAEKATFRAGFVARCMVDWSAKHTMESTKPCWDFKAVPLVMPQILDDEAGAHYVMTVHKRAVPGTSFDSATGDPDLAHPEKPATGDLDEKDNQIDGDYNSAGVATSERERIEAALAAAAATPVRFGKDSDVIDAGPRAALTTFASALVRKQPSDPLIPIQLLGFASAEGQAAHNNDLSTRRAEAVRGVLTGAGAPQPIAATGMGPTGAPDEAANRKVDIAVDHVFETTYAGNAFAGSPHEFGHMLGMPDEYLDNTVGAHKDDWGKQQTDYMSLVTAAGVPGPTKFGQDTSAIMSTGRDVLPRHYVTFWEALGRMTTPDITQAEWKIKT